MTEKQVTLKLHELGFYEAGKLDGRAQGFRDASAQLRATAAQWTEQNPDLAPAIQLVEALAVQLDGASSEAGRAGQGQLDRAFLGRPEPPRTLRAVLRGAIIERIERIRKR